MKNPFEIIEARLNGIEDLLLELKQSRKQFSKSIQSENFLTVNEAAKFLCLSKYTIYSKVSKGEIPFMKRSKRLYFSKNALIEYIKAGKAPSNSNLIEEVDEKLTDLGLKQSAKN